MPKQVDLSDPNLDLTQLCLRGDKNAEISQILRDDNYHENSIFAYKSVSRVNSVYPPTKIIQTHSYDGRVLLTLDHDHDIIYKSDFEAYNE